MERIIEYVFHIRTCKINHLKYVVDTEMFLECMTSSFVHDNRTGKQQPGTLHNTSNLDRQIKFNYYRISHSNQNITFQPTRILHCLRTLIKCRYIHILGTVTYNCRILTILIISTAYRKANLFEARRRAHPLLRSQHSIV